MKRSVRHLMGFTAAINLLAATATLTHATGRDEAAPDAAARMRADSARPLRLAESPGKGAPGTVVIPPKLPGGLKGPPDIVNPNKDKGPGLLDLSKEKPNSPGSPETSIRAAPRRRTTRRGRRRTRTPAKDRPVRSCTPPKTPN